MIFIFETLLDRPTFTAISPNQVHWTTPMLGLRVCDFDCNPSFSPPPLQLDAQHFEALFCQKGQLQITMKNGQCVVVKQQEILLLSDPSQIASIHFSDNRLEGILVALAMPFSQQSLRQICALLGNIKIDIEQVHARMQAYDGCAVVHSSIWERAVFMTLQTLPLEERANYCIVKTIELLYLLCCDSPLLLPAPDLCYYDRHQIAVVQQVHAYLMAHFEEHLTIQKLAKQFHLSATVLKSCFHQLYGKPIHKYLRDYRMQRAAELLQSTTLPILQIASLVGYESVSQFGVVFKRYYCTPPSQYRKMFLDKSLKP